MVDIFSKKKRSEVMSKIRGRNTSIEREVFSQLRRRGIYFQKHYKLRSRKTFTLDIALPRNKIAVFIDGDFWHGYNFTKLKERLPKKYWVKKIEDNVKRDNKNRKKLKKDGWKVLRIWEHDIKKNSEKAIDKIVKFLENNRLS